MIFIDRTMSMQRWHFNIPLKGWQYILSYMASLVQLGSNVWTVQLGFYLFCLILNWFMNSTHFCSDPDTSTVDPLIFKRHWTGPSLDM